jgi:CRP-like cAMP-binding protein
MDANLLRNIPFFSGLKDEEARTLVDLLKPRTINANETIFWIGESGTDFCIIQNGNVVLTYPDETGRKTP